MVNQQFLFPQPSLGLFFNAQQTAAPGLRTGNNMMTARNGVRPVAHCPVYQLQPKAVPQLDLMALSTKGPTAQSIRSYQPQATVVRHLLPRIVATGAPTAQGIKMMQFNTARMAAPAGVAPVLSAGAVKNAMSIPLKAHGHLNWNTNHTSALGANRLTCTQAGRPVTKMPRSSPVPALEEGTKQPLFPGGNKCGVATKNGEMYIKSPTNELPKFQNMLTLREEVPCIEEESNSGRLVAIDFDKTIAEIFLWAELGGLQGPDAQLQNLYRWCLNGKLLAAFGGQQRVDELRAVLQQCKKRGDLLCVLSSGYAKVIRPALKFMKLDHLIPDDLVYGSDTGPFGISKSTRVDHLKRQHNRPRATLVDDDVGYCRAALKGGHDVIWVKKGAGVQKREFDALLNQEWDRVEFLTHLN